MKANRKNKADAADYIETNEDGQLKCNYCDDYFDHLGSHLWHKHRTKSREYKEEFGLPYSLGMISKEVKEKKQAHANDFTQNWKENFKNNEKYQFKKGESKTRRVTKPMLKQMKKRLDKVNQNDDWGACPVCNAKFQHMPSHLYNKHKLIRVEDLDKLD